MRLRRWFRRARLASAAMAAMILAVPASFAAEDVCGPAVDCCAFSPVAAPVTPAAPQLGYQIWPLALTVRPESVAKLVALKPSSLRFSLGPSWRRMPPLPADISDADLDLYVERGFAKAGQATKMFAILKELQRTTKAQLLQIVWDPPPLPNEPPPPPPDKPYGRRLKSADVPTMARFLVAQTKYVVDKSGVPIGGMELSNEPDGTWNIWIAPADYAALVRAVRAEAQRRSVTLPLIYGPGTGSIATLASYLSDPKVAAEILDQVDVLSAHAWDDARGQDRIDRIDDLYAKLGKQSRRRPLALTEFAVGRPVLGDDSDRMNVRKRVDGSVALTPTYAAATVRELSRVLAHGVGQVVYWEFQDQSWGRGLMGLLDVKGDEKPVYQAVERFAVELDAQRPTKLTSSPDGRVALMIGGAGKDVLVAANAGEALMNVVLHTRRTSAPPSDVDRCKAGEGGSLQVSAGDVVTAPLAGAR